MDNASGTPFKEQGLCDCGGEPCGVSVPSRMGVFGRKKVSLRDLGVCESLPIFDETKQSEAKRVLDFGIKWPKNRGWGGVSMLSMGLTIAYTYESR